MTNLLLFCLLATSLAAAAKKQSDDSVLIEDGRHDTKVTISDDRDVPAGVFSGAAKHVKERIKEAASVLPNLGQGLSYSGPAMNQEPADGDREARSNRGPRELICDAYGKCKHKIANAMSRAKDKAEEYEEEALDAAGEAWRRAPATAEKAKRVVYDAAEIAREGAVDTKWAAEEIAEEVKQGLSGAAQGAKRVVAGEISPEEAAQNAKTAVKENVRRTKECAASTGKVAGNHILSNVSIILDDIEDLVSPERLNQTADIINLLGFATAFGMSVWISFINSPLLGKAIPRHQFGVVQSKIYPVYFKAMATSIGVALLAHVLGRRKSLSDPSESNQAFNLLVSLVMVLFNAYIVEPRATKIMFDRIKIEKEEGRGRGTEETSHIAETQSPAIARASEAQPVIDPAVTAATACASVPTPFPERAEDDIVRARADELNSKLKRFNSCSSLLNLITFLGLTWHLVYLSHHLHRC